MGKIIFWLVVVFAVLLVLRIVNVSKARARHAAAREAGAAGTERQATAMVRCVGCGVFLPKGEARPVPHGFHCGRRDCAAHAPRG